VANGGRGKKRNSVAWHPIKEEFLGRICSEEIAATQFTTQIGSKKRAETRYQGAQRGRQPDTDIITSYSPLLECRPIGRSRNHVKRGLKRGVKTKKNSMEIARE